MTTGGHYYVLIFITQKVLLHHLTNKILALGYYKGFIHQLCCTHTYGDVHRKLEAYQIYVTEKRYIN